MTVAISHVRIKGTTYWFRRRVPTSLTLLVGRKEILRSLRTSNAREARRRANLMWVQTDRIFEKMAENKDNSAELEALSQQIADIGKQYEAVIESQEQAIDMPETANKIRKAKSELDAANHRVELLKEKKNSVTKDIIVGQSLVNMGKLKAKPSPGINERLELYIA